MIYEWLTDEEKLQFNIEIFDEQSHFSEMDPKNRFFRILQYLHVKYVNLEIYGREIMRNLSRLNENDLTNSIKDILFSSEKVEHSMSRLYGAINEVQPKKIFRYY